MVAILRLPSEEVVELRNETLNEANKVIGMVEEKVLFEQIGIISTKVVESINEMKNDIDFTNPISSIVERKRKITPI